VTDNSFSKISRRGLLVGAGALAAAGSRPAHAVLNIDINQGNVQPMPIALPDFLTGGPT
jgi:TolB protein